VIFEFQGANRMRDAFDRVRQAVRIVIHWVDTPFIPCPVMAFVFDAVDDRVAHIQIRGSHVDFCSQHFGTIGKFTGAHALE